MCETKTVVVSISIILLVAASFCMDQVQTENKVGHHSKIKVKVPAETNARGIVLTLVSAIIWLTKLL